MPRLATGVGLSALLALTACDVPYDENAGLSAGVSVTEINPTSILISARGDGSSDIASIGDYALLRAADETLKRGYKLFRIVGSRDVSLRDAVFKAGNLVGASAITYRTNFIESYATSGKDILISLIKRPGDAADTVYSATEVELRFGPRIRGDTITSIAARVGQSETAAATSIAQEDTQPQVETHTARPAAVAATENLRVEVQLDPPRSEDSILPIKRPCNRLERFHASTAQRDGLRYELECTLLFGPI
jgi:hypothetical protein